MKKICIILFLGALFMPLSMIAGTKGVIKGKVTINGEPAYPAQVRVDGTSLGAKTKADGTYIIANVEAGSYSLTAGGTEYNDTKVTGVQVSADKTTNINIQLNADKSATEIVVVADAEMVDVEEIGSQTEITNEEIQRVPVSTGFGMVNLQRGVQQTGAGFQIRGSRSNESLVQLDGRDIGDQFTGDLGGAGAAYFPQASALATSSLQVIQGGQSAEYGNNMGGVVNTISKVGRTDRYDGFLSYRTDVPLLFGSQDNGLRLIRDGNRLGFEDTPDGNKLQGANSNRIEAGFGGPIPFLEGSTFYVSTNNLFEEFRSNSFEIYDPAGNNLGQLEGNQSWVKNITPRLRFKVTDKLEVRVGATYGMTNLESNSQNWYYARTEGVNPDGTLNGVPEWLAKQNVSNTIFTDGWARFNYLIDNTQFFDVTVGVSSNDTYSGRRANPSDPDPGYFSGFEILEPVDEVNIVQGEAYGLRADGTPERTPLGTDGGPNRLIDFYELSEKTNQLYSDGLRTGTLPVVNPISGYIEGPGNTSPTDNPYGLPNRFIEHGSQGFSFRDGDFYEVKGNYTNLFQTDSFNHNLKAGFEFRYNIMHRLNVGSPWTANGVVDMYTDQWGGNLYVAPQPLDQDAGLFQDVSSTLEAPFEPYRFAAFMQDQVRYKGIIFTPGLRLDVFDPQARYRTYEEQPLNFRSIVFIDDEEYFSDATIKTMVSPRVNIAYPLTDVSSISLNYGVYYQMPQLVWMYDGFNRADLNNAGGSPLVGNPNLEPQRTNSFEVSYNSQLTRDFAFTATTYYKDIYNQLGIVFIPSTPTPVEQTEISEYGVNQGLELEIRKNPIDDILGLRINYTFASIRGTSDGITTNRGKERDVFTQEFPFPLADYPLARDVRHRVNAIVDLVWRDDEGPTIAGIPILENSSINFTGIYRSGTPYTRTDIDGQPIGEINAERNPDFWTLNSRIQKGIRLSDIFGESMGTTQMNLYMDITNLFDINDAIAYNSATGDPLDNGVFLETRIGQFPEGPFYASSVPGISRSRSTSQYDDFGNRIYNANADANGDQIVTQQELYDAFIGYAEDVLSFRGNFQTPRQVFFGVNIQF